MSSAESRFDSEIIRRKLESLCRELGMTLRTVSRTEALRDQRDYATSIGDSRGAILATDNPVALGTLEAALDSVLRRFRFDLHEGDVFVLSDPHAGGLTTSDLFFVAPHQLGASLRAYFCLRLAVPDFGGNAPGGLVPGAHEIWAEGVPITPLKLRRAGRSVRDAHAALILNSRAGSDVEDIFSSVLSLLDLGARRLSGLAGEYGLETVGTAMTDALDYAERHAQSFITAWRTGIFTGCSRLDEDGAGRAVAVRARVEVSERLNIDLSASDEQRQTFMNCTAATAAAYAKLAVLAHLGPSAPANSGISRLITVTGGNGRVTSAQRPAAVGAGKEYLGMAIADAVAKGLREASGVDIGTLGRSAAVTRLGPAHTALPVRDLGMWNTTGCSAAFERDGWGPPHVSSRPERPSIEQWELADEVIVEEAELIPDSAGPGAARGAPGVRFAVSLLEPRSLLLCVIRDSSAAAGCAGSGFRISVVSADGSVSVPSGVEERYPLSSGDRLVIEFPAGRGSGDPTRRPRELVIRDLLDDVISAQQGRTVYGYEG